VGRLWSLTYDGPTAKQEQAGDGSEMNVGRTTQQGEEGDLNVSSQRAAWMALHVDAETRSLLDRDAKVFLHQMHELCFSPRRYTCEPAVELAKKRSPWATC